MSAPNFGSVGEALITEGPFRAWLQSVPPDTIVGRACREADCPLALFLSRAFPEVPARGEVFTVSPDEIYWGPPEDGATEWIRAPHWVAAFVIAFDDGCEEGTRATAATALRELAIGLHALSLIPHPDLDDERAQLVAHVQRLHADARAAAPDPDDDDRPTVIRP